MADPDTDQSGKEQATRVVAGGRALRVRRVRLTVIEGPDKGLTQEFEGERITIGTAPGNDLVLSDTAVSRHHCEITLGQEGFLLRDRGSTNGTVAGGLRVREAFVHDGVVIEVGRSKALFRALPDEAELELSPQERFGRLLGQSPAMRRIFAILARLAPRDVTVLVTGESGTGKELVARSLHEASPRAGGPFIVVDCGAMPATLMEDEILGHERGAFTGADKARAGAFERADGGTLFLDEVGELPPELQPKLLRVLESREVVRLGGGTPKKVDVRVIAATNRDLRAEVNRGAFRGDLFYRLSVVEVRMPPLRERPEDIPLLVRHFLDAIAARENAKARYEISPRTLEKLRSYSFPGNVRELRNFVERAVALAEGTFVEGTLPGVARPTALPGTMPADQQAPVEAPLGQGATSHGNASTEHQGMALGTTGVPAPEGLLRLPFKVAKRLYTEPFERQYLAALLERTGGNVSKASREADLDRTHLIDLLKKYGLR